MSAGSGHPAVGLSLTIPSGNVAPDLHAEAEAEVLRLFDACRDGVYRYARSFGLTPSDGEDVLQEVYLALFRHLVRNGDRTNLRGWIFRVTRNLALKRRAGQSRLAKLMVVPGATLDRLDPAENPEQRLVTNQQCLCFRAVVRALPDRDRECLRLRAEGLRYREIAQTLGISLGTVASSLARTIIKVDRADSIPQRRRT